MEFYHCMYLHLEPHRTFSWWLLHLTWRNVGYLRPPKSCSQLIFSFICGWGRLRRLLDSLNPDTRFCVRVIVCSYGWSYYSHFKFGKQWSHTDRNGKYCSLNECKFYPYFPALLKHPSPPCSQPRVISTPLRKQIILLIKITRYVHFETISAEKWRRK